MSSPHEWDPNKDLFPKCTRTLESNISEVRHEVGISNLQRCDAEFLDIYDRNNSCDIHDQSGTMVGITSSNIIILNIGIMSTKIM